MIKTRAILEVPPSESGFNPGVRKLLQPSSCHAHLIKLLKGVENYPCWHNRVISTFHLPDTWLDPGRAVSSHLSFSFIFIVYASGWQVRCSNFLFMYVLLVSVDAHFSFRVEHIDVDSHEYMDFSWLSEGLKKCQ